MRPEVFRDFEVEGRNDSDWKKKIMTSEICMEKLVFLRKETRFTKIIGGKISNSSGSDTVSKDKA